MDTQPHIYEYIYTQLIIFYMVIIFRIKLTVQSMADITGWKILVLL